MLSTVSFLILDVIIEKSDMIAKWRKEIEAPGVSCIGAAPVKLANQESRIYCGGERLICLLFPPAKKEEKSTVRNRFGSP